MTRAPSVQLLRTGRYWVGQHYWVYIGCSSIETTDAAVGA
jgi:hypothetical protein